MPICRYNVGMSEYLIDLSELDSHPWAQIKHAFGTSEQIPALIRELCRIDQTGRKSLWTNLNDFMVHQFTIYESTATALPYLIRLTEQLDGEEQEEAIIRIACWGPFCDRVGPIEPFPLLPNYQAQLCEADLPTNSAVANTATFFIELLGNTNPKIRRAAAIVMRNFLHPDFAPALVRACKVETDCHASAEMTWALARRRFDGAAEFYDEMIASPFQMTRFSAAVGSVFESGWNQATTKILLGSFRDTPTEKWQERSASGQLTLEDLILVMSDEQDFVNAMFVWMGAENCEPALETLLQLFETDIQCKYARGSRNDTLVYTWFGVYPFGRNHGAANSKARKRLLDTTELTASQTRIVRFFVERGLTEKFDALLGEDAAQLLKKLASASSGDSSHE